MTLPRPGQKLSRILLLARYLLPVLTGAVLLILSFFYNVYYYQLGERYVQSLFHFYSGTFTAMKNYLGGTGADAGAFYTWLTLGALVGVLCLILALTLSVFALLPVLRAFLRMPAAREKLRFKILFPNRVCLFLSGCLYLPAALFPHYFAWVCRRAGESADLIFVEANVPLIVTAALTFLTLALAFYTVQMEKKEPRLDPFTLESALPPPETGEESDGQGES